MPIALDPQQTIRLVLKSDRDKADPPTFLARALNGRQQRELAVKLDAAGEADSSVRVIDKAFEALGLFITGWENMGEAAGEYAAEKLPDVLTLAEAGELALRMSAGPDADELKNSASPSPSDTDASAAPVDRVSA